ncbi:hypothetical protein QBC34DRAFT_472699 [Podospora aff. communis PSN243]|uniref:Uncharacterized protein n=1 Tax=Podospora aff. communis PSN243 TaxID=3040156 RepID=A0AAV9GA86_9PEZI|nr:hypothetical protein QBC34DRAFT_472699 [Podospora aff. communis PSN243]
MTESTRTTNFLPLTTIFTPPTGCQTQLPTFPPTFFRNPATLSGRVDLYMDFYAHLRHHDFYNDDFHPAHQECYPDSWASSPYFVNPGIYLHTGYSPGICPSGYVTEYQTRSQGARTWAACCSPPRLGWLPSALATFCAYEATVPVTVLTWPPEVTDYTMLSLTIPTITTTLVPTGTTSLFVIGIHVAIMWESSDLPLPRSTTASTASSSGTPSGSDTAAGDGESNKPSALQNPGSIAAVALGVVIGMALLLGGLLFWWRRRRHRTMAGEVGGVSGEGERKVELQIRMAGPEPVVERVTER